MSSCNSRRWFSEFAYPDLTLVNNTATHRIDETTLSTISTDDAIQNARVRVAFVLYDSNRRNPSYLLDNAFIFLVDENPKMGGLNFHNFPLVDLERVTVMVNSTNGTTIEEPVFTYPNTSSPVGIWMPGVSNDQMQPLTDVFVQGFWFGGTASEHVTFRNVCFRKNKIGLLARKGYHLNAGQVVIEQCGRAIYASGECALDLTLSVERNDTDETSPGSGVPAWYAGQGVDIDDPTSILSGTLRHVVSLSFTGDYKTLTTNGGRFIEMKNLVSTVVEARGTANQPLLAGANDFLSFDFLDQDKFASRINNKLFEMRGSGRREIEIHLDFDNPTTAGYFSVAMKVNGAFVKGGRIIPIADVALVILPLYREIFTWKHPFVDGDEVQFYVENKTATTINVR